MQAVSCLHHQLLQISTALSDNANQHAQQLSYVCVHNVSSFSSVCLDYPSSCHNQGTPESGGFCCGQYASHLVCQSTFPNHQHTRDTSQRIPSLAVFPIPRRLSEDDQQAFLCLVSLLLHQMPPSPDTLFVRLPFQLFLPDKPFYHQ